MIYWNKERENRSKRAQMFGEYFEQSERFKHYRIYEEYPLYKINSDYKSKKECLDWVIKELKVAIEIDGEHHFKPVTYGGITKEEAESNFMFQIRRDTNKDFYCEKADWKLIRVSYKEKLNNFDSIEKFLIERIYG